VIVNRREAVRVAKAGEPSATGRVYPAAVLADAAPRLGPCPVRRGWGGPVVGSAAGWRYDGPAGWLVADLTFDGPPADLDGGGRAARWGVIARSDDGRHVAAIDRVDCVALVPAAEAGWSG
jgi:hypothetical protein